MSPLKPEEISQRLAAQGFVRQLRWKRYRVVSWRPDEMFPTPISASLAAKKRCLRDLGLNSKTDIPVLDQALALLPEVPSMVELSRRDAEGFKQKLSAAELRAYKRTGIMPITKTRLNAAVTALAKLDRPAAVEILARFNGARNTVELKPEAWQAVFEACEEARAKIEGAP